MAEHVGTIEDPERERRESEQDVDARPATPAGPSGMPDDCAQNKNVCIIEALPQPKLENGR